MQPRLRKVLGRLHDFITEYCKAFELDTPDYLASGEAFGDELQREAARHDSVGGDVLGALGAVAVLLWTSGKRLAGVPEEHNKELCSMLNAAIRTDKPSLMSSTAVLVRGINTLCVTRRMDDDDIAFPPNAKTYRGGGFDNSHKAFFVVGKKYRVPGFLATSFNERKADDFIGWADTPATVKWIIGVDPRGETNRRYKCKHVNLVTDTHVANEFEYLFSPYSVFTVTRVEWASTPDDAHTIELRAANDNDNRRESEDLPLAPWY